MPKVSIIIPTYNTANYISEAVDSALAQTYPDSEIIVVDDGSTDGTRQLLESYGHRIRYIYQDNQGVSTARNKGVQEAQGEYMAFLDADDIWYPDKIMKEVSVAEQNLQVPLFFSDAESFNEKGLLKSSNMPPRDALYEKGSFRYQISKTRLNDGAVIQGDFYKDLLLGNFVTLSTAFIRKEYLEQAGGFNKGLSVNADYDLWLRISRTKPILCINHVTTRYRVRDDSMSGKENLRNLLYQSLDLDLLEKQLHDSQNPYQDLIKKRMLEYYKTIIWGYYHLQDFKKVRTFCLRSLKFDKFQMKLYLYLLGTFLPAGLIKSRDHLS